MKLRNMKIAKQLNIILLAVFFLLVVIAISSWISFESLWNNTQSLYHHPFTVRTALGEIQTDILSMYGDMRQLAVEDDKKAADELILKIDAYEAEVHRQFEVLYERYLGDRNDIIAAHDAFRHWKTIRDETISLLHAGQAVEAGNRVKATGVDGMQAEKIMAQLSKISEFSKNKGNEFYQSALEQRNQNILQLAVIFTGVLIVLLGISYALRKCIIPPLKELTSAADALRQGKLKTRSRYTAENEFGDLSAVFNEMAGTLEAEIQHKENMSIVSEAMFKQDSLRPFCRELLATLLQFTESQIGAIYFLDKEKQQFEYFESIGLNQGSFSTFSSIFLEGEFGLALATGHVRHIKNIPSDIQVTFSTVIGEFKPKEIITLPIINEADIIAVISLAGIKSYSEASLRLIDSMLNEISARFNTLLAAQLILEFSQKLQKNNMELEAQAKELAVQTDELKEQNIELEMQKIQLDEASKLKSSFLSNMSHELRTPLNSVISLASVLNRRLNGKIPEEEYSYLDVIERNGRLLLSLVNDLLDLSRIEAGREEVNFGQFNINTLIDEIVETFDSQAKNKGIILTNSVSVDLPDIVSDIKKCRHILQNIIGNAVKFTDEGKVAVSSAVVSDEIHIIISDTGIGIAPEHLDLIFDEFRQVDETSSRKNGGTGLGLAIAKKYARLIGGSITVKSILGKGSTFTLKLPLGGRKMSSYKDKGVSLKPIEQPALPAGHAKRILLVEDSEPAVIQITDILAEQGYEIHVARNGKEALDYIKHNEPDGIILDLMMPEMDGFQVLAAIRGIEKRAHVPVLILTAKHITESELKFLKSNHVYELIQKGAIGKAELLAAVRDLVFKQTEPEVPPKNRITSVKGSGKPVILLVEDNPDNRIAVKALLKESYEITEAADGQAGIEQAKKKKPSLILLDISLPVLDGFKTLKEIRKDENLRHIPVIALTARAMTEDREEILTYDFDGYISKPISGKELEETIRRHLDGD